MTKWSLPVLLSSLHEDIQQKLTTARKSFGHPVAKGDSSESVWLEMLQTYLPQRYRAETAFIVDSHGVFSDQIDVVIFDRQYSPFIFSYQGQKVIPAESVYAVFEAKQTINSDQVDYAQKKIESVRKLYRTSLPIPYAKGVYPPKPLIPIYGGLLTFESDWSPAMGKTLLNALHVEAEDRRLDFGCVAAHGTYEYDPTIKQYVIHDGKRPATSFLFKLISQLQFSGTVPMIDVQAYAKWLADEDT